MATQSRFAKMVCAPCPAPARVPAGETLLRGAVCAGWRRSDAVRRQRPRHREAAAHVRGGPWHWRDSLSADMCVPVFVAGRSLQMVLITSSLVGVQFCWAAEFVTVTPYFQCVAASMRSCAVSCSILAWC
jgi:hypothetical protein